MFANTTKKLLPEIAVITTNCHFITGYINIQAASLKRKKQKRTDLCFLFVEHVFLLDPGIDPSVLLLKARYVYMGKVGTLDT